MIENINGIMVEICGERFPAANIQVWDCQPTPVHNDEHGCFYGTYFELMFESGTNLSVYQEMTESLNGRMDTKCVDVPTEEFEQHFIVEETHARDQYRTVHYAWHCEGEEELYSVLRAMRKNLAA